jgi:AcrR family transcriptional regulator
MPKPRRKSSKSPRGTAIDEPTHDEAVADAIVEAAVRCFTRFGIRKTAMDDIAEAAKLSRPTLYRYFPTRKHLVVEVLVREVRDHTRLVLPVIARHAYPPRALLEGILFDIATARKHPYTGIIVSEAGSEMLAKVRGSDRVLLEAMSEQWLPSLLRWRETGYLRADLEIDDVLLWITLQIHGALHRGWIRVPPADLRRMLARMVVPGLFDMDRLRRDFPDESLDKLVTSRPG